MQAGVYTKLVRHVRIANEWDVALIIAFANGALIANIAGELDTDSGRGRHNAISYSKICL